MNPNTWLRELRRQGLNALGHVCSFTFAEARGSREIVPLVSARASLPIWRNWWIVEIAGLNARPEAEISIVLRGWSGTEAIFDILANQSTRRIKQVIYFNGFVREAEIQIVPSSAMVTAEGFQIKPFTPSAAYLHMSRLISRFSVDLPESLIRQAKARGVSKAVAIYPYYLESLKAQQDAGCSYQYWIKQIEPGMFERRPGEVSEDSPFFSIVMPTFNTDEAHLRRAIGSVLVQTYPRWELCIVDDASRLQHVKPVIDELASLDNRIQCSYLQAHSHISAATNAGIESAKGQFVTFLDHDDELSPYALQEVAAELSVNPEADILYSDEDFLERNGDRCNPHFKSDWNPYLLYSHNYVSHLCVYRRSLIDRAGGLRCGVEGAQDYDLLLRCSALTDAEKIAHIPKILYHWRKADTSTASDAANKGYSDEAGRRALEEFFHQKEQKKVSVSKTTKPNFYRVDFDLGSQPPLVTLIIPTRDQVALLEACIKSIQKKTTYTNYEILVIDNRSEEAATRRFLERAASRGMIRVAAFDEAFNFARICNFGVGLARGTIVGLVNNDVEVISEGWLTEMVSLARRSDVGCVGGKLYYSDGTIQHGGVIISLGGYAAHAHRGLPGNKAGYFNRLSTRQNLSAVTAACLLVRRVVYDKVGGMDENLAVAYNDVDLCLRVREAGYLNVFTPFAELYHHESQTRGADNSAEKLARFQREKDYLATKWGAALENDPYYNPNLTRSREDFSIGL